MIRRSTDTGDGHAAPSLDAWNRPLPVKITGWAFLIGAALLILGGAYRVQSNMITTGLLFLAMGVAFAPSTLQMGWPVKVALAALMVIGAIYTVIT